MLTLTILIHLCIIVAITIAFANMVTK